MELIIKPTGKCNFNCKFCSSHNMDIYHPTNGHVPDKIKDLINTLKPSNIIVTGGEPLMLPPDYYYELYDISKCSISVTTNLKDFYLHPEKWSKLFKENWFMVTTSFNYGDTRMYDETTPYTEDMFVKIYEMFQKYTGKTIESFIAVIDKNNENTVLDHIYLAKKLGCKVRLNNAIGVGLQEETYQRYMMFKHYIDIIDKGLDMYECNCIERFDDKCPRNTNILCESSIRCCYLDNNNVLHVGTCDERLASGDEIPEEKYICEPDTNIPYNELITENCLYCELYRLCNACKTNRIEAKKDPNYCIEMMKLEDDIIRTGWSR